MKGAFDVFKSHGSKLFGEESDETTAAFEEALEKLLLHAVVRWLLYICIYFSYVNVSRNIFLS